MIDQWLLGVENLIVRAPGVLARLGEPNYTAAKAGRIYFDEVDNAGDDVGPKRPFFVLKERSVEWSRYNVEDLAGHGVIEVTYTETATDVANPKQSKLHFVKFVGDLLEAIASMQNRPMDDQPSTTHLTIGKIKLFTEATRAPLNTRDPLATATDYWWAQFALWIGEPND